MVDVWIMKVTFLKLHMLFGNRRVTNYEAHFHGLNLPETVTSTGSVVIVFMYVFLMECVYTSLSSDEREGLLDLCRVSRCKEHSKYIFVCTAHPYEWTGQQLLNTDPTFRAPFLCCRQCGQPSGTLSWGVLAWTLDNSCTLLLWQQMVTVDVLLPVKHYTKWQLVSQCLKWTHS